MAEDAPVTAPTAEPAEQPERAPATETPQENESDKVTESESKPAENATATEEKKEEEEEEEEKKEPDSKPAATEEPAESKGEGASEAAAAEANGTPSSAKKSSKDRRRSSGVGDNKSKLSRKKSMTRITHLHVKPGEYYLARLRSYPPWPSIICDEQMLPKTLLDSRPVTAMRSDGTYKEEYADSGKRAHERTFPVMFFATNEFAWIPNTQLTPLDPAECKDVPEKNKSKPLVAAYKIAAEGHDLQHFKNLLADHQAALQQEIEEREAQEAAKAAAKAEKEAEKEAKKAKRKSKGADTDIDMEDADDKKKSSKKRKKDAETDGEGDKPTKTPKTGTKLKLSTPKAPGNESGKKAPASKSKKAAGTKKESKAPEPEKQIDPEEEKEKKTKEVRLIRHRLQKAFISRDTPPKDEEMDAIASFFDKLEKYRDLEVSIIRATKVNKVLKMIVKLNSIPRDEEFHFRQRALNILSGWKSVLDGDLPQDSASKEAKLTANGAHKEDSAVDTPKLETEEEEKELEAKAAKEDAADTPMLDAEAKNEDLGQSKEAAEGDKAPEQPAEAKPAEVAA